MLLVIETKVYTSSHRHDRIVSGQWKRGSGLTEDCSVSPPPPPVSSSENGEPDSMGSVEVDTMSRK